MSNQSTQSISDICDHVHYTVSVTDPNVSFGSTFPVGIQIAPLRKGLAIKYITLAVLEKHILKIPASAAYAGQTNIQFLHSRKEYQLLSQTYDTSGDELISPEPSDLCWSTTQKVSLPQDPEACTQSVSSNTIKITHTLAFTIGLSEVQGQNSITVCSSYLETHAIKFLANTPQITGSLPLNIFMSPFGPTNNGSMFEPDRAIHGDSPPPPYSDHTVDLKLSDGVSFDRYTESPVRAPPYTRLCEY